MSAWSQRHRSDDEGTTSRIVGPDDQVICVIAEPYNAATANLIEAAPDLYDALEWVLSAPSECDRCKRSGGPCVGHTALAKARGE